MNSVWVISVHCGNYNWLDTVWDNLEGAILRIENELKACKVEGIEDEIWILPSMTGDSPYLYRVEQVELRH